MQGSLSGQVSGNVQTQQVAGRLLSALEDQDTGVAAEATSTLTRTAAEPDGVFFYTPHSWGLYKVVVDHLTRQFVGQVTSSWLAMVVGKSCSRCWPLQTPQYACAASPCWPPLPPWRQTTSEHCTSQVSFSSGCSNAIQVMLQHAQSPLPIR